MKIKPQLHKRFMTLAVKSKLRRLQKDDLVRKVGVLVGGTAFAQALTILVLPVLTRLYDPSDFAVLAVYVAMLSIISSIACLRFEIAIPLPKSDDIAIRLMCLALLSVIAVTGVVSLFVFSFSDEIGQRTNTELIAYLWLLPVGVFFFGVYTVFQYWAVRRGNFKSIAKTRIVQSISGAGTQVGLGFAGATPLGLLLGQIAQSGAGAYRLARSTLASVRQEQHKIHISGLIQTFREYSRYPKYSTWEALANSGAIQFPII